MATIIVKTGEYKGKPPSLMRSADDKFPFTFGVQKAKLIIPAIEYIKAFIAKYDKSVDASTETIEEVR